MRDSIFISYSREDRRWVDELHSALAGLDESARLSAWDDSRIVPAAEWRREIDAALQTAAAAVLLLSPGFFASEFIRTCELPALLAAARGGHLKLFPVLIEACDHREITELFQAVNDPARPLASVSDPARRPVWARLRQMVAAVASTIDQEQRIGAELIRLRSDLAARPEIRAVIAKIEQATTEPAPDELRRENALCFLEGERCQLLTTALMEEMQRPGLTPLRSTSIVREMRSIAEAESKAQARATELTQIFATQAIDALKAAQRGGAR